jgi:hypothetical protein
LLLDDVKGLRESAALPSSSTVSAAEILTETAQPKKMRVVFANNVRRPQVCQVKKVLGEP